MKHETPEQSRASAWRRPAPVLWLTAALGLSGCLGAPDSVQVVQDFELERYLGRWYEIARLDHSFERGLSHVTAEYSLREDGGVTVVNRGFDAGKQRWNTAEGKAYFVGPPDVGQLKVSFFGPFYGAYNIIALDHLDYQWALVCGPDLEYLWLLSRSPQIPAALRETLLARAAAFGFDVDALIFVEHRNLANSDR